MSLNNHNNPSNAEQKLINSDKDVTNSYDVEIDKAANFREDKSINSNPTKPTSYTEISRHPRLF